MKSKLFVFASFIIVLMGGVSKSYAANCLPAELMYCSFPVTGFKVGRINDLKLDGEPVNVDLVANELQIDAARFIYDESRIHTNTQCNLDESILIGTDVEIAFTLDEDDRKLRTISEIWVLPCDVVQLR